MLDSWLIALILSYLLSNLEMNWTINSKCHESVLIFRFIITTCRFHNRTSTAIHRPIEYLTLLISVGGSHDSTCMGLCHVTSFLAAMEQHSSLSQHAVELRSVIVCDLSRSDALHTHTRSYANLNLVYYSFLTNWAHLLQRVVAGLLN